jgi:hypothetical protein
MIRENAVGCSVFEHVVRHVDFAAINEARDDRTATVQLGDNAELIAIQEALLRCTEKMVPDTFFPFS